LMSGGKAPAKPLLIPPVSVITRQSTDTMAISDHALISALAFIRQNVRRPIQVRDVAARAGVSRRVLERRFEETLGRSPAAHIGKVRLDQVKALLVDTDLPVNDVAEKCGFCSPEYMTAIFRKHLHTTPLRYRRETRGR
jgi:LacI family transcriptional regulator